MYTNFKEYLKQNGEYAGYIDDVDDIDDIDDIDNADDINDVDDIDGVDGDLVDSIVEDTMYELSNNDLYTKARLDNVDGMLDESNIESFKKLYEANPFPSDAEKNAANNVKLQTQLLKIAEVFSVCFEYLGQQRSVNICTIINERITKLSADFVPISDDDDAKKLEEYKKALKRTCTDIVRAAKAPQADGNENINIIRVGGKLKIIDRSAGVIIAENKVTDFFKKGWNWVKNKLDSFWNYICAAASYIKQAIPGWFSGKNKGRKIEMNKVKTFFNNHGNATRPSFGDGDNEAVQVLYAKNVTNRDITAMNGAAGQFNFEHLTMDDVENMDVTERASCRFGPSFFRSLVLVAMRFGPKTISDLLHSIDSRA